jgi:capsular polysaccharide transport system permease protein
MPESALATRGAAADVATGDRATAPIALARPPALPRREDPGGVALFRERGSVWNGDGERRRSLPLTSISFLLVVVLPVALAGAYYFLLAADQYVAEFRFGLRSAEPVRADPGAFLQQGVAPLQIGLDSYVVVQYIASRAIVDDLDKTLDLRRMFSTQAADWPARLHLPVPIEELVAYWRGQVDAFFDATNGTIVVRARAFAPQDALALAQGILASSERLVNGLSARARRDTLRDSKREVQEAEQRLTAGLARLRDYRDKEGLIDPHKAADANAALAGRLRDELVRASTELSTLKQYMRDDTPALKILEARIDALKAQQNAVESEATDTETTRRRALSRIIGSYEELEGERRFAETAYQHALEALDRARSDADRQQIYIADFVRPSLPEEALYPRRLRSLGIVFLVAFAIWAIGSLTIRSVRDHLL